MEWVVKLREMTDKEKHNVVTPDNRDVIQEMRGGKNKENEPTWLLLMAQSFWVNAVQWLRREAE